MQAIWVVVILTFMPTAPHGQILDRRVVEGVAYDREWKCQLTVDKEQQEAASLGKYLVCVKVKVL